MQIVRTLTILKHAAPRRKSQRVKERVTKAKISETALPVVLPAQAVVHAPHPQEKANASASSTKKGSVGTESHVRSLTLRLAETLPLANASAVTSAAMRT